MKIAFVSAVWKRHEVFELFAHGVVLLQKSFPLIQIQAFVAGSEGAASKRVVEKFGFGYVETPNQPLGKKMNVAVMASKKWAPDFCVLLGSDDIIAPSLFSLYLKEAINKTDYTYLLDCYFFDVTTKKGLYWGGYDKTHNRGHAAGIGRMLSNRLMTAIGWRPWYDDKMHHVLDTAMNQKLSHISHTKRAINLRDSNAFALDIKSGTNMTVFEKWPNSTYVQAMGVIQQHIPELAEHIYYGRVVERTAKVKAEIYPPNIEHTAMVSPLAVIGKGTYIGHYAVVEDNVTIGENCHIGHHAVIGSPGEYIGKRSTGVVQIGDNVTLREFVTVHAPVLSGKTVIEDGCFVMTKCHIAHDCRIEKGVVMAPQSSMGGGVRIGEKSNFGQGVIVHPRLKIGSVCMLGMNATITKDVPDYQTWVGTPAKFKDWNVVGMERAGIVKKDIKRLCVA